jgi:SAM-dependent methyltransferase
MRTGYSESFAAVYDRLFGDFSTLLAPYLHQYFVRHRAPGGEGTLLDLCCGTGIVARYFVEHGVRVIGIDASEPMVRRAAASLAAEVEAGRAEFIVADAGEFSLDRRVDACISFDNAMNHVGDLGRLVACARRVRESLNPGGWFLFDLNTAARLVSLDGARIVDTPETFQLWRNIVDRDAGVVHASVVGFAAGEAGSYTRFSEFYRNFIFAARDVREALLADGWRDVSFRRVADLEAVVEDVEAEHIVVVVAQT